VIVRHDFRWRRSLSLVSSKRSQSDETELDKFYNKTGRWRTEGHESVCGSLGAALVVQVLIRMAPRTALQIKCLITRNDRVRAQCGAWKQADTRAYTLFNFGINLTDSKNKKRVPLLWPAISGGVMSRRCVLEGAQVTFCQCYRLGFVKRCSVVLL
jgi:hypothetical protein